MPEREHACEPVDKIQGEGEDGIDRDQIQDLDLVAVEIAFGPEQEGSKCGDGEQIENQVAQGGIHIFSSDCWPNRPVGLTRRTRTSTMKAKASR